MVLYNTVKHAEISGDQSECGLCHALFVWDGPFFVSMQHEKTFTKLNNVLIKYIDI